jgi:hypothetical protein
MTGVVMIVAMTQGTIGVRTTQDGIIEMIQGTTGVEMIQGIILIPMTVGKNRMILVETRVAVTCIKIRTAHQFCLPEIRTDNEKSTAGAMIE